MAQRIKIGWAQTSITPDRPAIMEGQMYMRYSKYVHDPITATALVLDNTQTQAILVSLDMTEVPLHAIEPVAKRLEAHGIPASAVSWNVTHSHNSSSFDEDFMRLENEMVYDPAILRRHKGLINLYDDQLYLTDAGMDVSNTVMAEFV